MRKLAVVALLLLLVVATPAWAGNIEDERRLERTLAWQVCFKLTGDSSTCSIKHEMRSETDALNAALTVIDTCSGLKGTPRYQEAYCPQTLAYIKARWGY